MYKSIRFQIQIRFSKQEANIAYIKTILELTHFLFIELLAYNECKYMLTILKIFHEYLMLFRNSIQCESICSQSPAVH